MMDKIKIIRYLDGFIFMFLLGLIVAVIFFFSNANIQHDSGDYYTILQKLTDSNKKPVIPNTHFVEQRSPGYSIISMLPYYFISFVIEPFVKTEEIIDQGQELSVPPEIPRPGNNDKHDINRRPSGDGSKMIGIPSSPLFSKDIFFKNYYIEKVGGWFEWKIIFALHLTSYILLFAGILFSIKTLVLEKRKTIGVSLPMLVIFTSFIFMHNIINTPTYATLTAFGLSSIFCFFFVKGFQEESFITQFLAGLFLGLLVLTRFETIIIAGILFLSLFFYEKWNFLKNLILGSLPPLAILLLYNFSQFGTPIHLGILRGDINQLGFNFNYITANLINPKSGIVFWSFLISLGLAGLFFNGKKHLKVLGVASLVLIGLLLVRVPVMYKCIGDESIDIGGVLVFCPHTMSEALMLIRFDANRYITVLAPFAILGLQNLFIVLGDVFRRKFITKNAV